MIGKVLSDLGNQRVFIVTKAGYAQFSELEKSNSLNAISTAKISESFWFSLSPDFLNFQIKSSLQRLNRTFLDGFLLHNPEYLLSLTEFASDKERVYKIILDALFFLEEKVRSGVIRYYGISSNTLPMPSIGKNVISLTRIYSLLCSEISNNHFKIIQFPFNAIEQGAVSEHHNNGTTLIDLVKKYNLISMGNRPLNAGVNGGAVRLATYDEHNINNASVEKGDLIYDCFIEKILKQLSDRGLENQWSEFPILVFLKDNWKSIGNPEAVHQIFNEHLYPFLNSLFDDTPPSDLKLLTTSLYSFAVSYSKRRMTEEARKIEKQFVEKGHIPMNDTSLSFRLCNYYLQQGLDHVLVGMRNERYVKDFVDSFKPQ